MQARVDAVKNRLDVPVCSLYQADEIREILVIVAIILLSTGNSHINIFEYPNSYTIRRPDIHSYSICALTFHEEFLLQR